uniref:Uncharacterized protein n=1 Tax=Oryza sativa subsp. japonica TaxID=39947 RepID=Q5Z474_ORYSJ|nr:hypothetical protein [Oryza sativa Japonica Group]
MATSEAARDEAAGASLGPTPSGDTQATTSGAAGDEAAGASLGPTPSGDAQDQPGPGDIPESGTSIGGPSRVASSPRRLFPTPSIALLNAEPLLQALAAANTTVLDGLSAQVEVLQAERAELDAAWARVEEGRRSVEAMVEVGRKAHRRHVSELETRKKVLAEIAKEVEEERGAALIATTVMNEAQDTLRLQYGSWEAELGKKLDAAQGVLDAAAAREQRAAETEAASRRREEALEARAMALEERACVVERDLADREAAVTIREATLAAHEAACAEEEFTLRLREDALTERERALEGAEAVAQQLAVNLSLREAAQEEQARRNLEGARAERAVLNQRAAELEARAKELDARARSGGAATGESDLAACLAAAERTIADLQGARDSSAGEVEALRLAGEVGPGMLWDAVSRLDCAGRQVGLWRGRTVKYAANQGGLAQRLSKMAGALQRLPEELEKTIKSSSRDLAQGAVELVLASYQARDPNFSPWMALDEFPPGTEDRARARRAPSPSSPAAVPPSPSHHRGSAVTVAFRLAPRATAAAPSPSPSRRLAPRARCHVPRRLAPRAAPHRRHLRPRAARRHVAAVAVKPAPRRAVLSSLSRRAVVSPPIASRPEPHATAVAVAIDVPSPRASHRRCRAARRLVASRREPAASRPAPPRRPRFTLPPPSPLFLPLSPIKTPAQSPLLHPTPFPPLLPLPLLHAPPSSRRRAAVVVPPRRHLRSRRAVASEPPRRASPPCAAVAVVAATAAAGNVCNFQEVKVDQDYINNKDYPEQGKSSLFLEHVRYDGTAVEVGPRSVPYIGVAIGRTAMSV